MAERRRSAHAGDDQNNGGTLSAKKPRDTQSSYLYRSVVATNRLALSDFRRPQRSFRCRPLLWVSSRYFRLSCLLGGLGGDGRHLGSDCGATIQRTDKRRKRTEYEKTALGSRLYTERADVVVDQRRLMIERQHFVALYRSAVLLSHQNPFHVAI